MKKLASKWLEMRSQIHRFLKKNPGEAPRIIPPPLIRGGFYPLSYSPPSRLSPLGARLRLSVPPTAATSLGPALKKVASFIFFKCQNQNISIFMLKMNKKKCLIVF